MPVNIGLQENRDNILVPPAYSALLPVACFAPLRVAQSVNSGHTTHFPSARIAQILSPSAQGLRIAAFVVSRNITRHAPTCLLLELTQENGF